MKEKENEELENVKGLEEEAQETGMTIVEGFDKPISKTGTSKKIQTTITDSKVLFNLEDHIDCKLNDMEGKEIDVTDVVIKTYEKDIPEKLNEYTGELETKERSIVTILLDKTGTSYVTASKLFAMRMIQLMQMTNIDDLHNKGIKIRITKTKHGETGNKKLGFEIV